MTEAARPDAGSIFGDERQGDEDGESSQVRSLGGTEVLYLADVDVPHSDGLVVAVRAAGINPGEAAIRQGFTEARFPATLPSGEGSDLARVVSEVGRDVTSFAVGDEVLGWSDRRSSHAEFVSVPEDHLVRKPSTLSWEAAGSLYVARSNTTMSLARCRGHSDRLAHSDQRGFSTTDS